MSQQPPTFLSLQSRRERCMTQFRNGAFQMFTLLPHAVYLLAFCDDRVGLAYAQSEETVTLLTAYPSSRGPDKHVERGYNVVQKNSGLVLAFRILEPGQIENIDLLLAFIADFKITQTPPRGGFSSLFFTLWLLRELRRIRKLHVIDAIVFQTEIIEAIKAAKARPQAGVEIYDYRTSASAWRSGYRTF